jgi:sugar O-acyltransferase (sialic acid O-acetyltransferase NeuD family)
MTEKLKIIIVGAREDGHGKVVLEILKAMETYEILGFLDDDIEKRNKIICGLRVLGTSDDLPSLKQKFSIQGGIAALADNKQRRTLDNKIKSYGLTLINAIHPTVFIDPGVQVGQGVVFCQGVIIISGTEIGDCVNIHTATSIDHDNKIESGVNIGPGVHTAGRVHIGANAFIGTGCSFIPDITIGEGAVIGAGSVVIRDIKPFQKVAGVPARPLNLRVHP